MASGNGINKLNMMLNKNRITKGSDKKITHTSLDNPKGSFDLSGELHGKFMDVYCETIENGYTPYLTECHLDYSPILIDIDIKYQTKTKSKDHKYSSNDIELIINMYNKYIKQYFSVNSDDFKVYLLEKKLPSLIEHLTDENTNTYKYKDGVHIMYPFIWTNSMIQEIIRENVIVELKENDKIIELIGTNELSDVIDEAVIKRNNWLMYGSAKPNYEANKYLLSRIYNEDMTFISVNELSSDKINKLPKTLSIRQIKDIDELAELNENYTWGRIEQMYTNMFANRRRRNVDDIRVARKLCEMLNVSRVNNYQTWIELGWCLHNIDDSLLIIWVEMSKYNSKFKNGDCEKRWKTFRNHGYNIGSLHRWAKHDKPDEYAQFILEEYGAIMKTSLTATDYDVAKAFYEIYKNDFKCASIEKKIWYEFTNHKWIIIQGGHKIYNKLNEDMVQKYLKMAYAYGTKASEANDEEKSNLLELSNSAIKLTTKLRTKTFKDKVLGELINLFYDQNFSNNLDENRDLLCFNNGVYDLKNDIFREGRPEDYISLCTNINFKPYDENDINIIKVRQFLSDIQPDEDMRDYIIDLMASCLQGHTPDEKFHIWTGSGGNGKSLSINLLQKALGDYACTLPITILTSKRPSATSANPEMAKTKGKRFCVFQEPEYDDKIHVGYMKEISGGDIISARGLFKEPIEFHPQFKLILTCNNLPDIPANDGGTWRRLRVVEFEMKFVDNPDPKDPKQKKKNPHFKNEFDVLRESLMSILIHRFTHYKIHGLKEPNKVTLYTSDYQRNSDVYLEYIAEKLTRTNSKDKIKIIQLFSMFKMWYKNYYNNQTNINQKEFKSNMLLKLPNCFDNKNNLIGYKFIDDEDVDENEPNNNIPIIESVTNDYDCNTITICTEVGNTNTSHENKSINVKKILDM